MLKMGLISDRKNKTKQKDIFGNPAAKSSSSSGFLGGKRGIFGSQILAPTHHNSSHALHGSHHSLPHHPLRAGVGGSNPNVNKYPPGYYTTPIHSSSSSWSVNHPGQPKANPNVSPRYQTWVAPPRKQQASLNQLVSSRLKD